MRSSRRNKARRSGGIQKGRYTMTTRELLTDYLETVRPIVTLAPYRTFQEVEQPVSQFVFRVDNKRNVTLAEADGGMWKLDARRTVKQYLCGQLADEIASGRVIVTL